MLSVQVLGADGAGTDSDIIAGVVWAADHGADVILMAFSNPGYSAALQAAIDYAWSRGAVLVAATGNDGSTTATYPAGDRHVIGVSGTDRGVLRGGRGARAESHEQARIRDGCGRSRAGDCRRRWSCRRSD